MFGKLVDLEAQPAASKRNALSPLSFRNVIDKNNHGRPMIRWRRLRPVLKEAGKSILRKSPSNKSNSTAMTKSASSSSTLDSSLDLAQANPLRFLEEACPPDVLPLVLAYAGPQKAAVLQRTNRHWKKVLEEETTWKVMCQELYKVRTYVSARIVFFSRIFLTIIFCTYSGMKAMPNLTHGRSFIECRPASRLITRTLRVLCVSPHPDPLVARNRIGKYDLFVFSCGPVAIT